jgi:UDP-glucose 4-epimerase
VLGKLLNVIIGSKGYIGSNLAAQFDSAGIEYIGIPSRNKFLVHLEEIDFSASEDIFIYWCAAAFLPNSQLPQTATDLDHFQLLLKTLAPYREKTFMVILSSAGIFQFDHSIPSRDFVSSRREYFRSKIMLEEHYTKSQFRGALLRVANVYGSKVENQFGVIASWIRSLKDEKPVLILDSLNSTRDYIHIDDLIRAISYVSQFQLTGIFYVGTGIQTSLGNLIEIFKQFTKVEFVYSNPEISESHELSSFLSPTPIDWFSMQTIESGIKSTLISEGIL